MVVSKGQYGQLQAPRDETGFSIGNAGLGALRKTLSESQATRLAMQKAITSFALVAVLTALLMTLSLFVARHGYPFGVTGMKRLDGVANADTFLPLAAIYFLAAMLMMILPLKAASIVLLHAADMLYWVVIALFATIVGCLAARWAFGQTSAPWALFNWRFLVVAAVVGCHLAMNELRRNVLLRSLFFAIFGVATLACLFWSFRL